jgi:hypothetical protein
MALVALAANGGTPAKTKAGKVKKLPPPAIALSTPAAKAAAPVSSHKASVGQFMA